MSAKLFTVGMAMCARFVLYGMSEISDQSACSDTVCVSLKNFAQSCYQKATEIDDLNELLKLKAIAERNGCIESVGLINSKLSKFSNPEELAKYIASFCRDCKKPQTLDEISCRRHSVEIITALSLFRNQLPCINDQKVRLKALRFYNIICSAIQRMTSDDE